MYFLHDMVQFLTGISNICTATSGQITHICPGLSVNEIQIPNDKHHQSVIIGNKLPKHSLKYEVI